MLMNLSSRPYFISTAGYMDEIYSFQPFTGARPQTSTLARSLIVDIKHLIHLTAPVSIFHSEP